MQVSTEFEKCNFSDGVLIDRCRIQLVVELSTCEFIPARTPYKNNERTNLAAGTCLKFDLGRLGVGSRFFPS